MSRGITVLQTAVEPRTVSLGWQIVALTAIALAVLIGIGWYSSRRNVGTSTEDFFSASKSLGFLLIGLSVFADSFSGNSFLGHTAATYRSGAWFLVFPQFMLAGLIGTLVIAPPLVNLSQKWDYTSPIDYIEHRFDSRVAFLALLLMIWGTFVQFIEQFIAMGYLGQIASGGVLSYRIVVLVFGVVILTYVGLGGFRGTAIAAGVQGLLMLLAVALMLVLLGHLGGFSAQIDSVWRTSPEKLTLPGAATMRGWYGLVILVLLSLPTYIHVQQFYLSVKDASDLRRTFRVQAPVYLFAALVLFGVGLFGAGLFPGLSEAQSERLVPYLFGAFTATGGGTLLPSVVSLGIVMATLSTAGAAVMVLSMAVAKDMYQRFVAPDAPDARVINAGRLTIVVLVVFAIVVAFTPDLTLWGWVKLKLAFLLQATPVFLFGLYLQRVKSDFAIAGMIVGCLTAIGVYVLGGGELYGFNAGVVGFVVNSVVFVGGSYATSRDGRAERVREILAYNAIETAHDDGNEVAYVLPAQRKSFWIGLAVVLALMVPWYAPASWNARAALDLPIWTWVVIGALFVEVAFVFYGLHLWRARPVGGTTGPIATPDEVEGDD